MNNYPLSNLKSKQMNTSLKKIKFKNANIGARKKQNT